MVMICCVCVSSATARPKVALDICYSDTPQKHEKPRDVVFRFLKKELTSNQTRESCEGAKSVQFVRKLIHGRNNLTRDFDGDGTRLGFQMNPNEWGTPN
jgi:hypothetical protein